MTLTGVLAPLPTPFNEADGVDLPRLRAGFDRWLSCPLTGFVMLGTSGEAGLLTDDEADRVIEEARALVPSGRSFIVGTGRDSTTASIRAAKRAAALGADAVLVRTPSFFKAQMTDGALSTYYTAVAEASPVPVLLYNFTAATGVDLLPRTVSRLAEHQNVIGIKESGSDLTRIAELVACSSSNFSVLAGSGSTFFGALRAGVSGGILAVAGVLPETCARLFNLVKAGELSEAQSLQQRLLPIAKLVSAGYGVPGLKAALKIAGIDVGPPRPPLVPVGEDAIPLITHALSSFEEVFA
jgi:4-hydroxy-2-oxoglutarate aldolase